MTLTPLIRIPRQSRLAVVVLAVFAVVMLALELVLPHFARLIDNKMQADPSTRSFTQVAVLENDSWWWDETVTGVSAARSDLDLASISIPDGGRLPNYGQIRITLHFKVRDCARVKPGPVVVAVHMKRAGLPHTESLSQEGFDFSGDGLVACGLKSS